MREQEGSSFAAISPGPSHSKDGNGWRILFVCPATKKRRTIRTGKCAKKNAETARNMIERLIESKTMGSPVDQQTAKWLESIDGKLRGRLVKMGLIDASEAILLGAFLDGYVDQRIRRGSLEDCTVVSWGHTKRNLIEFFGADRRIGSITSADADEWAAWMADNEVLAENTVRKRSANAKMFFRVAVRRKQISENPFESLVSSVVPSRGRQFFIPRETVDLLLEQCPDPEFRLLILFARYLGVRVPSEIVPLKWGDVDWDKMRIVITSPKTKLHRGGAKRVCPIFPEIAQALLEAWEVAPEGTVDIFPAIMHGHKNLRTWLLKAIVRSGQTPWPRLWQNFRATRATELADSYPSRVAAAWLGHTEQIADGHYRQVTGEHYSRAASEPTGPMPGAKKLAQIPAQSPHVLVNQGSSRNRTNPTNPEIGKVCGVVNIPQVGVTGLEPVTSAV